MTTPRHGATEWDDTLDVDRALQSLDEVGDVSTTVLGAGNTFDPPTAQRTSSMNVMPDTESRASATTEQTVLRRKRPTRRTDVDDGRTLRRDPRTRPAPVNAVPSMPYADDAVPTPATTGRMRPVATRRRTFVGAFLLILALRLAAIGLCALVVLMAAPSLVGRLSLLRVVDVVTSVMPAQLAGVLVIPTPFDGAFRGDFAIAAFGLFVIEWLFTRLRARLRSTGVRA